MKQPSCGNIRVQQMILRLLATVTLIVIVPQIAVEKLSWFVSLGEPSKSPST